MQLIEVLSGKEVRRKASRIAAAVLGLLLGVSTPAHADAVKYPPPPHRSPYSTLSLGNIEQESQLETQELARAGISDTENELTQKRDALGLLLQLSREGMLSPTKLPIGWIVDTPVNFGHEAYQAVLDRDASRSFLSDSDETAGVLPDTSESAHGTWALYSSTQLAEAAAKNSGNTIHAEAGLCQAQWCRGIVAQVVADNGAGPTELRQALPRYTKAIRYLVDSGVGVIASFPTWRESDLGISPGTDILSDPAVRELEQAFQYALAHNVLIIIPAGNANVNMRTVSDLRILHELARRFPNVLIVGGVNNDLERATWEQNGETQGSNYGDGYIDFVLPTALDRSVPAMGTDSYIQLSGTTFTVGEMAALLQAVQMILSQEKPGTLPAIDDVLKTITQTIHSIGDPDQFGQGVPLQYTALRAAEQLVKFKAAGKMASLP